MYVFKYVRVFVPTKIISLVFCTFFEFIHRICEKYVCTLRRKRALKETVDLKKQEADLARLQQVRGALLPKISFELFLKNIFTMLNART